MKQNFISVLIVDDNKEKCYVLKESLNSKDDLYVCDVVHDGYEAIKAINEKQPDVVLLDVIMTGLDGIGVLHKLKEKKPEKVPKVIMISSLSQGSIPNESIGLGASYYMLKPFNIESLYNTIKIVFKENKPYNFLSFPQNIDDLIRKKVISIGIPTSMLGYQYIIQSIGYILKESYAINLSKNIYAKLASNYLTNSQCIESAIRNAIKQAALNPTGEYKKIFSEIIKNNKKPPSNLIFLTNVAENMKIEYNL